MTIFKEMYGNIYGPYGTYTKKDSLDEEIAYLEKRLYTIHPNYVEYSTIRKTLDELYAKKRKGQSATYTYKQNYSLYGNNPDIVILDELPETLPINTFTVNIHPSNMPDSNQSGRISDFINSLSYKELKDLEKLCNAIMSKVNMKQDVNMANIDILKTAYGCLDICSELNDQVDMFFEITGFKRDRE